MGRFEVEFNKPTRILIGILVVAIVATIILTSTLKSCSPNNDSTENDTNVYLGEEVCYAGKIYLSVVGLNVAKSTDDDVNYDDDGDKLSAYTLNLKLSVECRTKDNNSDNRSAVLKSDYFSLKETNLENKEPMGIFFENLAKATLSAMLEGSIDGSINIIESTASFALDYVSGIVDEVSTSKSKLKPIKASKNQFEPFRPSDIEGKTYIDLSFQMKENYLESNKTIVLSVDTWNHIEKHIFLITRPDVAST